MDEEVKRTTNKELKEILDRLVTSAGETAQHKSEANLRIHVLELEMTRRIQFETSVNARLEKLPEQVSKAIHDAMNTHSVTCPFARIADTSKRDNDPKEEPKKPDKDAAFGTFEFYRDKVDRIIWATIQAIALVLAAKYFTGN